MAVAAIVAPALLAAAPPATSAIAFQPALGRCVGTCGGIASDGDIDLERIDAAALVAEMARASVDDDAPRDVVAPKGTFGFAITCPICNDDAAPRLSPRAYLDPDHTGISFVAVSGSDYSDDFYTAVPGVDSREGGTIAGAAGLFCTGDCNIAVPARKPASPGMFGAALRAVEGLFGGGK